ncbi:hypothetical protein L0Y26_10355 [Pectobacterium aroidearum]|uniref:hypothetical protein n=1 Tax=Pectobacterium aroidearum TaxID=1201031 RepID=UPI00211506D2|nr:hypothetical protein [Pectobacterium aroidearum]UUE38284.1 hypothetical protein L0Y26_10355 [Pectobacterium aroidearum]UUE42659.1 hypothetical protein L0Y25_10360 [Pectobacterium aroidearum]
MKPEMSTAVMIERVREMAADSADSQDHVLLTQVANRIELLLAAESGLSREMACIRHALDIPPDQSVQSGVVDAFVRLNAEILGLDNGVTAEHQRVIEMLLSVCGAAFELADDTCQQEVDGEQCITVPHTAFEKLSDALDEIENSLSTEDADRPDVFLAWAAMPRAALKSILQPGNYSVIPEGWALVPTIPTDKMITEGKRQSFQDIAENNMFFVSQIYKSMLAAAPQRKDGTA